VSVALAAGEVLWNPLAEDYRRDPYPTYHRMRELDPVHWSPGGWCWVLTRHDHVKLVLSDRRFGIGLDRLAKFPSVAAVLAEPFNKIIRTQILAADPPDHTRIRALATRTFAAAHVEALRARIQHTADTLLDGLLPRGRMDFIHDFAYPLPFTVICDTLNIPPEERPPLEDWTRTLMRTTDPMPMSRAELDAANDGAINFRGYFLDLARERRARPTDDLFSDLVQAAGRGEMTEEEFVANTILIFCAGHDTVVHLFGNGLLALHRHPEQLALLRRDPGLIKNAIDELLRYDASIQIARRVAFEPVEIGGRWIAEDQYVLCLAGAANRDPDAYPDPDRLDVTRKDVKPLSFGGGIHYCLGAYLARVEGQVVFETLLRRLPGLALETLEPEWNQNTFIRGLKSLMVTF
jgi:cytochrome P450